jgi:hypothetical protein
MLTKIVHLVNYICRFVLVGQLTLGNPVENLSERTKAPVRNGWGFCVYR